MTETLTPPRLIDHDAEAAAQRQTLTQMRAEAEQEVQRINAQIAERQTISAVASVTAQIALQQEMTVLNQTLTVKTQELDHITDECRRLEDALEDQNVALDSLQQEIVRKEHALTSARAEVERMRHELTNRTPSAFTVRLTTLAAAPGWRRFGRWRGVAAVLVMSGSLAWLWREQLAILWHRSAVALTTILTPAPALAPPPASSEAQVSAPASIPTPVVLQSLPATQRDRLRSGGLAVARSTVGRHFSDGR